jgi:predicted ribonuclease YlaK
MENTMARNKVNRTKKQENVKRRVKPSHESKTSEGSRLIVEEQRTERESYKLDWFKPTEAQGDIIYSLCQDDITIVQGSSGCGKSTTAIWQALKDVQAGLYRKIVFVKSATESADDGIGFLPSSADDKLKPHFEATVGIFQKFMTGNKLDMEIKHGRIVFKIPNFLQGESLDDAILILDEAQNMSPETLKLCMERTGTNSKLIVLGDERQKYALKKRVNGFTHFNSLVTGVDEEGRYSKVPTIGYIELPASENMRSAISKLVVSIYEDSED